MPTPDPSIAAHLEWLGFVRPTGLVVSAPALARHGATLNRHDAEGQQRLRSCVEERAINGDAAPQPVLPDFRAFAQDVLDWRFFPKAYAGTPEAPMPPEFEVRPQTPTRHYARSLRCAGRWRASPQTSKRRAATQRQRTMATANPLATLGLHHRPTLTSILKTIRATIGYYAGPQIEAAS